MLKHYLRTSSTWRHYLPDWLFGTALLAYFFLVAETAQPFARQFSIENPNLQHPFATTERVTDNQLYLLAVVAPAAVITVVSIFQRRRQLLLQHEWLNLLLVLLLGLFLCFTISAVITDILKVWIARPRPDFIARCGPKRGTDPAKLVGLEVCTAPLGQMYLLDGMKLTPSGHLSVLFAGLLYLSLWLMGQFKLAAAARPRVVSYFVPALPLLLATYISLNRAQDYRHHFVDIIFGGVLGVAVAVWNYAKLFHQDPAIQEKPLLPS